MRLFWNHVFTCASVIFRPRANEARSADAKYFCLWNRFSNSATCNRNKRNTIKIQLNHSLHITVWTCDEARNDYILEFEWTMSVVFSSLAVFDFDMDVLFVWLLGMLWKRLKLTKFDESYTQNHHHLKNWSENKRPIRIGVINMKDGRKMLTNQCYRMNKVNTHAQSHGTRSQIFCFSFFWAGGLIAWHD